MASRPDWAGGSTLPARRFLADSVPGWVPFPDTNAALERLRAAGYALGILSNIDDDLLAATRRHFTVEFELLVTAQQVRAYKPARPHFETARRLIGTRRWLHVGQGYFHDVVPARALGLPIAWINRNGEAPFDGGQATGSSPRSRSWPTGWRRPDPGPADRTMRSTASRVRRARRMGAR